MHNLISRAWVEEFAAEADTADSSDTDDEDDWHALMGKRKKKTIQYSQNVDNMISLALTLFDSAIGCVGAILVIAGTQ